MQLCTAHLSHKVLYLLLGLFDVALINLEVRSISVLLGTDAFLGGELEDGSSELLYVSAV